MPLLCIILEAKFGVASRQWFTDESKVVDLKFKWDDEQGMVVPLIPEDEEAGFDLDSDDEYCSQMLDLLGIDSSDGAKKGFEFDIDYIIDQAVPSKNQFGDSGSVKTFRQECIPIDEEYEADSTDQGARSPSPDTRTIVVGDAATQATSALTEESTHDIASSLEQMILKNPELAQELFSKYSQSSAQTAAVFPNEGLTAIKMDPGDRASTSSPWEQFGLRNDFGKWGNNAQRRESAKARKKRMKGMSNNSKRKKKKNAVVQKELHQSHFAPDGGISYDDAEAFGDALTSKPALSWRAGLQNVNLLPTSARHHRSRQVINHIREAEHDVFFMNEVGINWAKLDACDQWSERTIGLPGSTAIFANNTTEQDLSEKLQYGGVGTVVTDSTKHSIVSRGKDRTGMGRWVWMRMEGKNGHHVRLVCAYRPCISGGAGKVFQQHKRAMATRDDFRCPRTATLEDLAYEISQWKTLGGHVMLGMDANEDARSGEVNDVLQAAGLHELILDLHRDLSPPATHNRNNQRQPIDGLWGTGGLTPSTGGYLAFGAGCPSDHR